MIRKADSHRRLKWRTGAVPHFNRTGPLRKQARQ
jgi:hypothetical protein